MAVTPADIAVELGRPLPDSGSPTYRQWATWITDARMIIENRLGDLALLDQTKLSYVVRKAVAAHVKRPDDATQVDITVDDSRVSKRYAAGKGEIGIADAWWALLDPELADAGAFSVSSYGDPDTPPLLLGWPRETL